MSMMRLKYAACWIEGKRPKKKRTVRDMRIGEVGYIVEWAVDVEKERVDLDATIQAEPRGTVCLKIKFTNDGYVATFGEDE